MLSEQERQTLAEIEVDLLAANPILAPRLSTLDGPPRHGPLGISLVIIGVAVVLATVTVSLALALVGAAWPPSDSRSSLSMSMLPPA